MSYSYFHKINHKIVSSLMAVLVGLSILVAACSSESGGDTAGDTAAIDVQQGDISLDTKVDDASGQDAAQGDVLDAAGEIKSEFIEETVADVIELTDTNSPDKTKPDKVEDIKPEFIPEQVIEVLYLCSEQGGGYNIFDLQNPECPDHPYPEPKVIDASISVDLNGKIVTAVFGDSFFIQEPKGGPYSGIHVYAQKKDIDPLAPGMLVDVKGKYYEFFDSSQLWLDSYDIQAEGYTVQPYVIEHPSFIATEGPYAEMFEGVFVRVNKVYVISTKPDCPYEFGEFMLNGMLRVDDMGEPEYDPYVYDKLLYVTGPLHYTFGNFKLEPRGDNDLYLEEQGDGSYTKCIDMECIEAEEAPETGELVVTEIMFDAFGTDQAWEYFEVYNPGAETINLDGWTFRDCAVQVFVIDDSGASVAPGGYFVLARDAQFPGADYYYPEEYYLPNTQGAILVYNPQGQLVDQVRYEAFEPWPYKTGHAMELIDPSSENKDASNWKASDDKIQGSENFGSPGH